MLIRGTLDARVLVSEEQHLFQLHGRKFYAHRQNKR